MLTDWAVCFQISLILEDEATQVGSSGTWRWRAGMHIVAGFTCALHYSTLCIYLNYRQASARQDPDGCVVHLLVVCWRNKPDDADAILALTWAIVAMTSPPLVYRRQRVEK